METIEIRTARRAELVEITGELRAALRRSGVREGVLVAQSLHTTAGLTVNENADPDVARDLVAKLGQMVPQDEALYRHAEGNSDSHLKTLMCGPSLSVLVSGGELVLGQWQGIYFCEWDGPRQRRVAVQVLGGGAG